MPNFLASSALVSSAALPRANVYSPLFSLRRLHLAGKPANAHTPLSPPAHTQTPSNWSGQSPGTPAQVWAPRWLGRCCWQSAVAAPSRRRCVHGACKVWVPDCHIDINAYKVHAPCGEPRHKSARQQPRPLGGGAWGVIPQEQPLGASPFGPARLPTATPSLLPRPRSCAGRRRRGLRRSWSATKGATATLGWGGGPAG